ncbi:hypothetical protein [Saccharospirillum mangrovi]|nr:hypothetical protein [Saccharospirillum mangrovi]
MSMQVFLTALFLALVPAISHSAIEPVPENRNCFDNEDINNLNLYFEALSTNPTEDFRQYGINFEGDEISELQRHFQDSSFDSFIINHDEADCDQHLGLKIYFRLKVLEDDEVFYSETMRMYLLYKREGAVIIEFAAVAG